MFRKCRQRKEMKRLITAGAKVWLKWFYSERDLPVTDEEMAKFGREAVSILGDMGVMAAREGWIDSDHDSWKAE